MNIIKVEELNPDTSFKIKTESYLYLTAKKMLEYGKGDRDKLMDYMKERIEKIEKLSKVSRPMVIVENGEKILEVSK